MDIDQQVKSYELELPTYEEFARKLKDLIETILDTRGIQIHIIEARAKDIESLREKLQRPGKSYKRGLKDISDFCGLRIITYYADDCLRVADIIKDEFRIVEEELSHQPESLQADQFGYLSAHYVIKLKRRRSNLTEWAMFQELAAEVQIRTVIQHAWSAVSHALQYKAETEVPSLLRRRLFRIAGIFELADEEFSAIRDQRNALRRSAFEALSAGNTEIPLNIASIEEFLNQWAHRAAIIECAENAGFTMSEEIDSNSVAEIYELAKRQSLNTVSALQHALESVDTTILGNIFNAQIPIVEWKAGLDFIVTLMLLSRESRTSIEEALAQRDWATDIKSEIKRGLYP